MAKSEWAVKGHCRKIGKGSKKTITCTNKSGAAGRKVKAHTNRRHYGPKIKK